MVGSLLAIPGLLKLEIGLDVSQVDYACDVVLYAELMSRRPSRLRFHSETFGPAVRSTACALRCIR